MKRPCSALLSGPWWAGEWGAAKGYKELTVIVTKDRAKQMVPLRGEAYCGDGGADVEEFIDQGGGRGLQAGGGVCIGPDGWLRGFMTGSPSWAVFGTLVLPRD